MSVVWIIVILLIAGLILQLSEFFIPSFGLITVCAMALFGIAVYLGFKEARWLGWTTVGSLAFLLAGVLILGFRLLPRSPLVLKNTVPKPNTSNLLDKSVGRVGIALTDMRPVGRIRVGEEVYEGVSPGPWVEKGAKVLITGRKGSQLTVRPMLDHDES